MLEAEREERDVKEGNEAGEQPQPLPPPSPLPSPLPTPPPTPAEDIRAEQEAGEQHALMLENYFIRAQHAVVSHENRNEKIERAVEEEREERGVEKGNKKEIKQQ